MSEKTYEIQVICHNCHHVPMEELKMTVREAPQIFDVPKGTEVKKFLQGMTCENCGCNGYMGLNS